MSTGLDLGGAVFTVSANNTPFTIGLRNSEAMAKSFSRRLSYLETIGTKTFSSLGSAVGFFNRTMYTGLAGLGALVGVGAAGLGVLGAASVKFTSDAAETQNKFDVLFGTTAKDSAEALFKFGGEVHRSRQELLAMAADFRGVTRGFGTSEEVASQLAVQLSKLGVDLGSFNNIADSDAAQRLQSGLIGNHEALRSLNIFISEATIKQELLRMGLKGSAEAATDQQKQLARLNIIMRDTSLAQGDAERTSGSFSNQMKALWAVFKDTASSLGSAFIPTIQIVIDAVLDMMTVFNSHIPAIQEWGVAFAAVFSNVMNFIRELAFAVYNYDTSWEALKLTVIETLTHMYERIVWFAEAGIGGFKWLWENAYQLALTHANNMLSVLINLGSNIVIAFREIWNYIATGGDDAVDMMFKSMTDGFQKYNTQGLKDALNPEFKETDFSQQRRALEDEIQKRKDKMNKLFDRKKDEGAGKGAAGIPGLGKGGKADKIQVEIVANEQLFRKNLVEGLKKAGEREQLQLQQQQVAETKGIREDGKAQHEELVAAVKSNSFGFV